MSAEAKTIIKTVEPRIRIVRAEPKAADSGTVELDKIRRELLTLASRVEKLTKGQETA